MNVIFNRLAKLFSTDFSMDTNIIEKSKDVSVSYNCNDFIKPSIEEFTEAIKQFCTRDTVKIVLTQDNTEFESFYLSNNRISFDDFLHNSEVYINGEKYSLLINVEKQNVNQTVSVYFIDEFIKNICNLSVLNFLVLLKSLINDTEQIIFEIQDTNFQSFSTNSILFKSIDDSNIGFPNKDYNKSNLIDNTQHICFNNLISTFNFIPDDFVIRTGIIENLSLKLFFENLTFIYSISFLFDITTLNETNALSYKLNGYKTFHENIEISTINTNSADIYYQIYKWVYTGGNIVDKIGLARNILSLNFNPLTFSISIDVVKAIHSSFKIYQKENIKQYIEIRNKISDQLVDLQNKADTIVEKFVSDYKTTFFSIVSFYITVIIITVISNGEFFSGFNFAVSILSFAFIIISMLIMIVSRWEIKQHLNRYENYYSNIKDRYKDLLDTTDINRILNQDKDFKENIIYIKNKKNQFTYLWIMTLAILTILTIFLFVTNCISNLPDTYIKLSKIALCYIQNM